MLPAGDAQVDHGGRNISHRADSANRDPFEHLGQVVRLVEPFSGAWCVDEGRGHGIDRHPARTTPERGPS